MINTPASFVKLYCIFVGTNQNKKIMSDFGIQQALNELGLQDINHGTSTGSTNFSNGELIESYSPVDGKLIGKVRAPSKEDYDEFTPLMMAAQNEHFEIVQYLLCQCEADPNIAVTG